MRIGDTNPVKPASDLERRRKSARGGSNEKAPRRAVSDVTTILGIPANELTPKVQDAITKLMAEVDKLRKLNEDQQARVTYLEQLADQDTLVPVANRRAFVRELSRVMSYSERYNTPASIIYFDVNGLKTINDTHGHAAGDAALVLIARKLAEQVRESDMVGRLGGDEFGVVLSHADESAATEKALQLIDVLQRTPLQREGATIPLKLAFGTYTFRKGENPSDALEAADRAMYEHKHQAKIRAAS